MVPGATANGNMEQARGTLATLVFDVYRFESRPGSKTFRKHRSIQAKTGYALCSYPLAEDLSMWNEDEVKGKAEEVKGKAKQAAGDLADDESLRAEGEAQEVGGKVQKGFGKARREVGNAIKDVGDAIKR